jgi:hypothetical protein
VVDNATATKAYKNFDAYFFPNPFAGILNEWIAKGEFGATMDVRVCGRLCLR